MENNTTKTGDFSEILAVVAQRAQEYLEKYDKTKNKKEYYFYLGIMYSTSKLRQVYLSKGDTIEFDFSIEMAEKLWKLYNSDMKKLDQISMNDLIPGILGAIKEYLHKKDKSEE